MHILVKRYQGDKIVSINEPLHLRVDHAPVLPGTSQRSPARQSRRPCTRSSGSPPWHRTQGTVPHTLSVKVLGYFCPKCVLASADLQ
jgi:hypothetical protein